MSNTLAIAAVTGVLTSRIRTLLDGAGLTGFDVKATHPDDVEEPGVYLHLYQILPNAGLRNETMPERRADSSVMVAPRLAIDLYYLLTFLGDDATFDGERLAGLVMTGLNEIPPLQSAEVEDFIAALPAGHVLAEADLGDQLDCVRITPMAVDVEELSRLWGMFGQSFHRISVGYRASVVLLDAQVDRGEALPVTTPTVTTFTMRTPQITAITSSERPLAVVRFGEDIVVRGQALRGDTTLLRLGGTEVAVPDAGDEELRVTFDAGSALRSGVTGVQVVHRVQLADGSDRGAAASNAAPVALVPTVDLDQPNPVDITIDGDPAHEVRLELDPVPSEDQQVELLLSGTDDEGQRTIADWEIDGAVVAFAMSPLPVGTFLVRVAIDGAVSLLDQDPNTGELVGPALVVT